jgi:hypothetical protein
MPDSPSRSAGTLRQELSARNASYARLARLPHVMSYGHMPVVVYRQSHCGRSHGNFIAASYRAILQRPEWHPSLQNSLKLLHRTIGHYAGFAPHRRHSVVPEACSVCPPSKSKDGS